MDWRPTVGSTPATWSPKPGELFVTGRAKDLIIVRGANHAPQEFEDCLEGSKLASRPGCAVALGYTPPAADGEELADPRRTNCRGFREGLVRLGGKNSDSHPAAHRGAPAHRRELVGAGHAPAHLERGKLRRSEALRRCHPRAP